MPIMENMRRIRVDGMRRTGQLAHLLPRSLSIPGIGPAPDARALQRAWLAGTRGHMDLVAMAAGPM